MTIAPKHSNACRPAGYDRGMDLLSTAEASAAPELRDRADIDDRYKWNLTDIFPGWDEWLKAYEALEVKIGAYAALQGSLATGALLSSFPYLTYLEGRQSPSEMTLDPEFA